ncbi:MAG: phosphotransferase [Candidatus Limnocylindria bacterium]
MNLPTPIFVITGQLSAGKSTIADALLAHYPFGYHIDVDGLREMVTSGLAGPLEWTDETTRQFGLAIDASAALAKVYVTAGFAVAIEGAIEPTAIDDALNHAGLLENRVGIVLRPRLDVALQRNRERRNKSFDTSILEGVMRSIDGDLARDAELPGWHALDNSDESVEATVERILPFVR